MFGILKKLFGTAQDRTIRKYRKIVDQINAWDDKFKSLSDDALRAKTAEFKERLKKGESLDSLLPEARIPETCGHRGPLPGIEHGREFRVAAHGGGQPPGHQEDG